MRGFSLGIFLFTLMALPASAQHMSAEDMQNAQKMAEQYMNDPANQAQMQQIQKQMKAQGVNPNQMQQGMKNMTSMNPKNMDAMMKMSQCMMDRIGEKEMEAMGKKGEALEKKIKGLCAAGKKADAEKLAAEYAKEMIGSREYKEMKFCSDKYKEAFNDPALKTMREQMSQMEGKKQKICNSN